MGMVHDDDDKIGQKSMNTITNQGAQTKRKTVYYKCCYFHTSSGMLAADMATTGKLTTIGSFCLCGID